MWLVDEFLFLLRSDVSSASVDQLIGKQGLWVINSLLHFAFGFAGFFCWVHFGRGGRRALVVFVWAYSLLQIVQLSSAGALWALALDGAFDIAVLFFGYLVAVWIAGREVVR